jgi:hypothetical protein
VYLTWYAKEYRKRLYTQEFLGDRLAAQKIIFGPEGFVTLKMYSKVESLWIGVRQIVHTERQTFILMQNRTGLIIPHRIFPNSTEIQGFKDRLGAMWNSGKTRAATPFNASAK